MNPQITRYTRDELAQILAAREFAPEGTGGMAWLDFRVRVTPELVARLMDGTFEDSAGNRSRLTEVRLDRDGCAVPVMEPC